jgi:hypothetical protein
MNTPIPPQDNTLNEILTALQPDHNLGVLLAAQVGGTPQELQLILQTTAPDEVADNYRPTGQYIIRALGVEEHRLALGLFSNIAVTDQNTMLHRYNVPIMEVHFKGVPDNTDGLMLELQQTYEQTYGMYRHLGEEVNRTSSLEALLKSGEGLLGTMAAPFVDKLHPLFKRYGVTLTAKDMQIERTPITYQLLAMDDSYIIAQVFSADPMGKQKAQTDA